MRVLTRPASAPAGPPPDVVVGDLVLRGAIVDVLGRVDRALEAPRRSPGWSRRSLGVDAVRAELMARVVGIAERLRDLSDDDRWSASRDQFIDLLLDVRAVAERVETAAADRRRGELGVVTAAIAATRRAGSLAELLEAAPAIVLQLGFRRVLLSAAHEGTFRPMRCVDLDAPHRQAAILDAGRHPTVLLDRRLREADLVRERRPILVADAQEDPRGHPGLRRATGWASYVAAPVTMRGDVVGFVHADRGAGAVTSHDAEVLGLLAEAAGATVERLAAEQRAVDVQVRVRGALRAIDNAFRPDVPGVGGLSLRSTRPVIDDVLTSREGEVLRLMATGATNAAIAASLVIAESTAKTHVKNVLRKLEVGNRAEAVSRFLGGDGGDGGGSA